MSNRLKIEDKLDTMNENLHKISLAIGGEVQKPSTWEEIRILCRNNNIRGLLEVGETVGFTRDGVKYNAVVMDFIEDGQHSSGLKLRDGLQTGVIFQTEKILYNLQFDEREAFYFAVDGLSAGTYNFTVGEHSWASGEVGKTYQFTLESSIPIGAQLVFTQSHNATLNGAKINIFANGNSTATVATPTMTEGSGGTSLGTIRNSISGNFNSCQRAIFGNNRYKESAIMQHLNSDKEAGNVWAAQNKFDRPPVWASSTKGFLNGLQKDLADNIAKVDRHVYRNTICDNGGYDEVTETIFLPSRKECFFPVEGEDDTEPFAFYRDNSVSTVAHNDADACRIKNNTSGSPYYWWYESPYVGYAHVVRNVGTAGAYDTSVACSSVGVAPAFVIA